MIKPSFISCVRMYICYPWFKCAVLEPVCASPDSTSQTGNHNKSPLVVCDSRDASIKNRQIYFARVRVCGFSEARVRFGVKA